MKNQLSRLAISGLLATGLTLCSAAAFAQQENAAPAPDAPQATNGHGQWGHQPMDPDQQVAHMTKRYSLTSDQQTQIKPILASRQQQMQALRQDSGMSREDKMAKMKSIRDDSNTKIQAVLNDSQKQKFAQDQEKRQEQMQERMQQRSAPPAAGPAAQ